MRHHHENIRKISLFPLIMIAFSAMIGSGWMFGLWKAATIAGPYAIFAWPIGAFIMLCLALNYAELSANYPKSGGMARFAQLSHGALTGFIAGWATWISLITVIPIEAISTIQYLSASHLSMLHHLYDNQSHQLNNSGFISAVIAVIIYFLINYWSLKLFLRFTTWISVIKLAVPLMTLVALFFHGFHYSQVTAHTSQPLSTTINQIFLAVATSGIIFSFHGFQSPINLAGEVINPKKNLPLALLISMLITFIIFELLQIVFIGSVSPAKLINGWSNLHMHSPFVELAMALNLNFIVMMLYVNATIAPSGTAITYTATASRVLSGMEKSGYMPKVLGLRHPLYQISRPAMWANLIVCIALLWFFRTWSELISVISACIILSYITGPVCVMVIRKHIPNNGQFVRFKGMSIIAPFSFTTMTYVLYWTGWPLTAEVFLIILIGLPIGIYYQYTLKIPNKIKSIIHGGWLVAYLVSLSIISYCGDPTFGGHGLISNSWANLLVAICGLGYFYLGCESGWCTRHMRQWRQSIKCSLT